MKVTGVGILVTNTGFTSPLRASLSSAEITESDPHAVPVRGEVFTTRLEIEAGPMRIPTARGRGADPDATAARRHASAG